MPTSPPIWTSGTPYFSDTTETSANVNVEINEDGKAYLVVVDNGDPAPTSEEVRDGQESGGGAPLYSDNISLTASTPGIMAISGLGVLEYDVYVVADDLLLQVQIVPVKLNLDFTTPIYIEGTPIIASITLTTPATYHKISDTESPVPNTITDTEPQPNTIIDTE